MASATNNSTMIVIASILFLSLFYMFNSGMIQNEGSLQTYNGDDEIDNGQDYSEDNISRGSSEESEESMSENSISDDSMSERSSEDSSEMSHAHNNKHTNKHNKHTNKHNNKHNNGHHDIYHDDGATSNLENIKERAMGLNALHFRRVNDGKYKNDSYRELNSGSSKSVDDSFKVRDITKNYTDNFVPLDESTDGAPINISTKKETEKDKYNVNAYLPKEKDDDWFETIETVNVKNSHLINIYRPIGVNTIGSTHKNSTYDLRGTDKAVCPKFVVAPWNQSSIEPDRSMKSLCG
jgi:hypothetical protein